MKYDLDFELDIGDGKRLTRISNIAKAILRILDRLSPEEINSGRYFVTKEEIRKYILLETEQEPPDEHGDMRATGDCCGGHGLNLVMSGRGPSAKVFINENNINKCKEFLENTAPIEFKF